MIKPRHFGYNPETAGSNAFQKSPVTLLNPEVTELANVEFDAFASALKSAGVDLLLFDEEKNANTPDVVFPNNWVSFHPDGRVVLYPMMAKSRRRERRKDIIDKVAERFKVQEVLDLSPNENEGIFLEGTGSIIFDHIKAKAFANVSPRTNIPLFEDLCERLNYKSVVFHARDQNGIDIYHTNVMMGLADKYAVICTNCIDQAERKMVISNIEDTGREAIAISPEQMLLFAGNVMQLQGSDGPLLVMSETARKAFKKDQISRIQYYNPILSADLQTIEQYGGGSARCMIAGIHLGPRK